MPTTYFETPADFWNYVVGIHATKQREDDPWRFGQAAFNVLAKYRPDLSERVRGTTLDPFYCEHSGHPTLMKFAQFVEDGWDCYCGAGGGEGCHCCTDECPEDCMADHKGEQ